MQPINCDEDDESPLVLQRAPVFFRWGRLSMENELIDVYSERHRLLLNPLPTAGVLAFSDGGDGEGDARELGYTTLIPRSISPWKYTDTHDSRVIVDDHIFTSKFNWLTNNLFRGMTSWDNVAVAGTIVAEALLPHTRPPHTLTQPLSIDLVLHSVFKNGTIKTVMERLQESFKKEYPLCDCRCVRYQSSVMLLVEGEGQLIARMKISQAAVLSSYLTKEHVDCFACCYNGTALVTRKALFAYNHRTNTPDPSKNTRQFRKRLIKGSNLGFQAVTFKADPTAFVRLAPESRWTGPRAPKPGELRHIDISNVKLSKEVGRQLNKMLGVGENRYTIVGVGERREPGPSRIPISKTQFPNLMSNKLSDSDKRSLLLIVEQAMCQDIALFRGGVGSTRMALEASKTTVALYTEGVLKGIRIDSSGDECGGTYDLFYDVPPLSYAVTDDQGSLFFCEGPLCDVQINIPSVVPMYFCEGQAETVFSLFEAGRQVCKNMRSRRILSSGVYALIQFGIPVDCIRVIITDFMIGPCNNGAFLYRCTVLKNLKKSKGRPIDKLTFIKDEPPSPVAPLSLPSFGMSMPFKWDFITCDQEAERFYSKSDDEVDFHCARSPSDLPETSHYGRLFHLAKASDEEAAALAEMELMEFRRQWLRSRTEELSQKAEEELGPLERLSQLNL